MGNVTTSWQVQAGPEYIQETTYGSLPSNAVFSYIGPTLSYDVLIDKKPIRVPNLGMRDFRNIVAGGREYGLKIEYSWINSTFAKLGVNTGNESLSWSVRLTTLINSANAYIDLLGMRFKSVTVSTKAPDTNPVKVAVELWGKQIPNIQTETAGTNLTDAADPGTAPSTFVNTGLTIGGIAYDTRDFSYTIDNMPERIHVIGSGYPAQIPVLGRKVTGTFTILNENTTQLGYMETDTTNQGLVFTNSGSSTTTMTTQNLVKIDEFKFVPQKAVFEKYAFEAFTSSVTMT